jgi:intracellular multiplication protein IcmO
VVLRKPTNAPTPYLCILDEYGYYAVQGFAVVPAQARSLGFSVIFAGQDLPAFQKASKEEAASIGANTNIKICMKLEDPTETWDFFTKTAGEAYVTKVDSFQTKDTSLTNSYLDTKSSSFEKRARVDLLDLKEQTEGEAHIFFKSKIIRARMFYANPKPVKQLKVNQFMKVEPPPDDFIQKLQKQLVSFNEVLQSGAVGVLNIPENEEITGITTALNEAEGKEPIERAVKALLALHKQSEPVVVEEMVEETPTGALTIFSALHINENLPPILAKDKANFAKPLLPINDIRNTMMALEKFTGAKDKHASLVSSELVKDFQTATKYPPEQRMLMPSEEIIAAVKQLCGRIVEVREKKESETE